MEIQIVNEIKKYQTIIIHRHVRPDPDALGSQGGLAYIIKDNFPEKDVFVVGEEVNDLMFLNHMDHISDTIYNGALVVVCDTANQERISDSRYHLGDKIIKIDHHPNDDPYGDLIWVDTDASSVSEMIVALYESMESKSTVLSKEAARLLYAGIVGDTGRFLYSNTTKKTFEKAGRLQKAPFDRQTLFDEMYKTPLPLMRLNGYILEHFILTSDGVGYAKLPLSLTEKYSVKPSEASLLINTFSNVENIKAWVFFIEEPDQIRVRLRSKGPIVNRLAAKYNGGGHPLAAGATVYSWDEAEEVLVNLREVCLNYK